MRKTYIHVNRQTIFKNAKHGTDEPAVRIQNGKYGKSKYCHEVEILGPSKIVYSAHEPILKCGARLVIETESEVNIVR